MGTSLLTPLGSIVLLSHPAPQPQLTYRAS